MTEKALWRIFNAYVAFSVLIIAVLVVTAFAGWSRQSHSLLTAAITILFSLATVWLNLAVRRHVTWLLSSSDKNQSQPEPTLSELDKAASTEALTPKESCAGQHVNCTCTLEKGHDGPHCCDDPDHLRAGDEPRYWT